MCNFGQTLYKFCVLDCIIKQFFILSEEDWETYCSVLAWIQNSWSQERKVSCDTNILKIKYLAMCNTPVTCFIILILCITFSKIVNDIHLQFCVFYSFQFWDQQIIYSALLANGCSSSAPFQLSYQWNNASCIATCHQPKPALLLF